MTYWDVSRPQLSIFAGGHEGHKGNYFDRTFVSFVVSRIVLHINDVPLRQKSFLARWEYMDLENLAKRIRGTCIEAVLQAHEDAGIQGLCEEGRWEAAVDALRTVDLVPLLRELKHPRAD